MEHQFSKFGKWNPTQDLMVPFEDYSFHAVAFAIDPTTNSLVCIAMFGVLDTPVAFVIRSHDAAVTRNFTYESGDGLVTITGGKVSWKPVETSWVHCRLWIIFPPMYPPITSGVHPECNLNM